MATQTLRSTDAPRNFRGVSQCEATPPDTQIEGQVADYDGIYPDSSSRDRQPGMTQSVAETLRIEDALRQAFLELGRQGNRYGQRILQEALVTLEPTYPTFDPIEGAGADHADLAVLHLPSRKFAQLKADFSSLQRVWPPLRAALKRYGFANVVDVTVRSTDCERLPGEVSAWRGRAV